MTVMAERDQLVGLLGLRAWKVESDGEHLRPWASHGESFAPGWNQAECVRGHYPVDHEAPSAECHCGFHARLLDAAGAEYVFESTNSESYCETTVAVGLVEAGGRTQLATEGFRSARMRLRALVVYDAVQTLRMRNRKGDQIVQHMRSLATPAAVTKIADAVGCSVGRVYEVLRDLRAQQADLEEVDAGKRKLYRLRTDKEPECVGRLAEHYGVPVVWCRSRKMDAFKDQLRGLLADECDELLLTGEEV